ncbi:MAG TPA: D-glycerate dehydrogenase [Candidatus Tectomicrobia bacterium]|nr:D-glycerate dehydrogenase [Candidatus Tectomicrobia bacterium]
MRPQVFVSRIIPQEGLDIVLAACDAEVNTADQHLSPAELADKVKGKEGLLCLLTDDIDEAILGTSPRLKVVANVAVGYDNIDVPAATRRKIIVTNTPGVLDNTTADFTWCLLLASARRLAEAERYARAGKYTGWGMMLLCGEDVFGKTIGICGLGRIGRGVAKRAQGFDMRVLYTDAVQAPAAVERELGVQFTDKETLFRDADFVTLHVPLLPETHHYVSVKELRLMKKSAHLINASRGPVVDEIALVQALRERWIAGAGLDVYEHEPHMAQGLIELDNVTLAPHIASASVETRMKMAIMAATNLVEALQGRRPPNIVNPEVLGP